MLIEPREMTFPSGEHVTIRSAAAEDAESLCAHRTITSAETYFMSRYPEECIYDIDVMRASLTEIAESPKCFMVTAFLEGRVIADLGVSYVMAIHNISTLAAIISYVAQQFVWLVRGV